MVRLSKLGCRKSATADGYRCDIELDVSTFGIPPQDRSSARMVRGQGRLDGLAALKPRGLEFFRPAAPATVRGVCKK